MPDIKTKRTRSVINPVKIINELRAENNLPKIGAKPKAVKITPAIKSEITRQIVNQLFPEALTKSDFQLTEKQTKELLKEVESRLNAIRGGKEPAPMVKEVEKKPVVKKVSVTTKPKPAANKKPAVKKEVPKVKL